MDPIQKSSVVTAEHLNDGNSLEKYKLKFNFKIKNYIIL
jgi:hypothetical protein